MKPIKEKKTNAALKFTLLWVIIALLATVGVTYAWFTFSSYTNVTPIGGAIGNGGVELLISNSEDGEFGNYADLVVEGNFESMKPVSTADLYHWSTSVSTGNNGISNKFRNVTDSIEEYTVFGRLYLKASGGDCDVYFNRDYFSVGSDEQLIASSRLGMETKTEFDGEKRCILRLDDLSNTRGADEQNTMAESNVVVESTDDSGSAVTVNDPSEEVGPYIGYVEDGTVHPGEKVLCRIRDGEVICLNYRLYMEGCDPNCINAAQDKSIDIKLGFVGIESKD